jgi:hypothetical protein
MLQTRDQGELAAAIIDLGRTLVRPQLWREYQAHEAAPNKGVPSLPTDQPWVDRWRRLRMLAQNVLDVFGPERSLTSVRIHR